jgi:toxin CptA
MPLPLWLKLGLGILAAASGIYHVMDALLRLPWSLVGLELNGRGELHMLHRDGQKQRVTVSPGSVVTPTLTLLNLKSGNRRQRHMLITPDRVDPEAFRQLRVWLRWSRQAISGDDVVEVV